MQSLMYDSEHVIFCEEIGCDKCIHNRCIYNIEKYYIENCEAEYSDDILDRMNNIVKDNIKHYAPLIIRKVRELSKTSDLEANRYWNKIPFKDEILNNV